jgi:hypothetical protein
MKMPPARFPGPVRQRRGAARSAPRSLARCRGRSSLSRYFVTTRSFLQSQPELVLDLARPCHPTGTSKPACSALRAQSRTSLFRQSGSLLVPEVSLQARRHSLLAATGNCWKPSGIRDFAVISLCPQGVFEVRLPCRTAWNRKTGPCPAAVRDHAPNRLPLGCCSESLEPHKAA